MIWWIPEFYKKYQFQLWMVECTSCEQLEEIIYNEHPLKQKVELIIASDPKYAYYYAEDIIGGPWPLGEKAIVSSPTFKLVYEIIFNVTI